MSKNSISKFHSLGSALVGTLETTKEVREYCRSKNMTRVREAFVVEGFQYGRQMIGLSTNV